MADKEHLYRAHVTWTGNRGVGTRGYRDYGREHEIASGQKPVIPGSSDPNFRGDATRWNPEDLLVASLSTCHQLWYLHVCSAAGIVVTAYVDEAEGVMVETDDGGGRFASVTLRPHARLAAGSDPTKAAGLHHEAHAKCFIANSVNFPVSVEPSFEIETEAAA
jgi:organic hydroperoxide reductase OsmC/OhrA